MAAIIDHRVRRVETAVVRRVPSPRPLHWVLPSYPIYDTIHNTYSVTAASSRAAITAPHTPQQTTTTRLIATMQMMMRRPSGGGMAFESAAAKTRV